MLSAGFSPRNYLTRVIGPMANRNKKAHATNFERSKWKIGVNLRKFRGWGPRKPRVIFLDDHLHQLLSILARLRWTFDKVWDQNGNLGSKPQV